VHDARRRLGRHNGRRCRCPNRFISIRHRRPRASVRKPSGPGSRGAEQPEPDEWRVMLDPAGHPFCPRRRCRPKHLIDESVRVDAPDSLQDLSPRPEDSTACSWQSFERTISRARSWLREDHVRPRPVAIGPQPMKRHARRHGTSPEPIEHRVVKSLPMDMCSGIQRSPQRRSCDSKVFRSECSTRHDKSRDGSYRTFRVTTQTFRSAMSPVSRFENSS